MTDIKSIPSMTKAELKAQGEPTPAARILGQRKAKEPCSDCVDGWCTMNCGPAKPGRENVKRSTPESFTVPDRKRKRASLATGTIEAKGRG